MVTDETQNPAIVEDSNRDSRTMTVDDAKNVYLDYGNALEEFYTTVYQKLISHQRTVELPNSNYLHALQLTTLMLRNTSKNICMLGGSTTDNFMSILEKEFRKALVRLRELGGKARIIALNAADNSKVMSKLAADFPDTLSVMFGFANDETKIGHFMVADDMVRVEEPHKKLTPETPANTVKARVIFNSESQVKIYSEQFDSIWRLLTRAV